MWDKNSLVVLVGKLAAGFDAQDVALALGKNLEDLAPPVIGILVGYRGFASFCALSFLLEQFFPAVPAEDVAFLNFLVASWA